MIPRIVVLLLCLALSTSLFAKGKKKAHINLPKVTDTLNQKIAVHEDINFYGDYPVALSSSTIDYGFSPNWDIGVGAYNVPIDSRITDYDISVLFTIERTFAITPALSVIAGSSIGSDIVSSGTNRGIDIYSYLTSSIKIWNINLSAGGYFGNAWFAGYNSLGFAAAISIPLSNKWSFQYDYVSGSNNLSGATYQLFYRMANDISLGFGIQPQYSNREQIISGIVSLYYR